MDVPRFDRLARSVAAAHSRRRVLKVLAGGAAGLLAAFGPLGAGASVKVTICHKPGTPAEQTMGVSPAALGGHLGHGDYANPTGCCGLDRQPVCVDASGTGTCCPAPGRCLANGTCCTPATCPDLCRAVTCVTSKDPCLTQICKPATGLCERTPDGTPCDNGTCQDGICRASGG